MNRQPTSMSALAASYAPAPPLPATMATSGSAASASTGRTKKKKIKKKRLRPQKHISRWSEVLFGGGGAAPQTNRSSQLDSIEEGFEEEVSSSSESSSSLSDGDSGGDDTVQRSGQSKQSDSERGGGTTSGGDSYSPVNRGRTGPLHQSLAGAGGGGVQHDDDGKIAAESSARSLDYVSATADAATKPSPAAAAATAPYNHASNATLQTAASTAEHEQSQCTLGRSAAAAAAAGAEFGEDWIEPLPSEDTVTAAAAAASSIRRFSGGHRRSSNSSSGSGTGAVGGGSGGRRRPRLHSIPDDIEVNDGPMQQQQFQQSVLTMRGALSASSEDDSDNVVIERKVAAALAKSAIDTAMGAAANSASACQSAIGVAPNASTSTPAVPSHRSSSFTGSQPIKDGKPQARSSSLPLIDDDGLDIENIAQALEANSAAGAGPGMGAQASSSMSAGLVPPVARSLITGRLNDSANSLGGGRTIRRTSDVSNAESIASASIAAASWMGSMGDSDLSGSSSDCEGDGPNRQRLRTRRRRKPRRQTEGRRMSNGGNDDDNAPAPTIVVEGASVQQSRRRRRTSWTRRPDHLSGSAPAGTATTYRDRRSSEPICSHEVARAIADMEADLSDLDGDSSSDDGNGYEKAPGSQLDAIVASLRAATANSGNNNARRNATNQRPRDLHDLFRPNRILPSTAPREPNSFATNAPAFHSSWPNRPSASMPALDFNTQISHAAASPSVEPVGTSNAAFATSTTAGAGIRRQDESFANVEDLIRASLQTQSSSLSLRSQQGEDVHDSERNAQSWPIVSSHRGDVASAAAVGVAVGARTSNNRSDSIIDALQNLDLRQHVRDHGSASTFNIIDDQADDDVTTATTATGSQAGEGSLQTNPLMVERQAILGFGQELRRPGDSGHRISNSRPSPNSRPGMNSGPSTSNLPPTESGGPIRGLDALGAAIGAIAAAAPDIPPPSSNSLISTTVFPKTLSTSTDTHRSLTSSAGAGEGVNTAPSTSTPTIASSAGSANVPASTGPPAASVPAPTVAPTTNVRRRYLGPTPLYEAVASGSSYDTIKSMIDLDPRSTGHQNGAGLTPLHTAIERYDVPMSIIRLLLASNPSTASMPRTDGRTPLDLLWKRCVDPDSFRIQSSILAANKLATLMEMAVSDDGCHRPPSSQSGSEGDIDLEEGSESPSGLSKRDMDRKARAMRILLSNPLLRDFWDLMTLFVRAAHHGTIADPLPAECGRWRIVHSCVATRCEPLLIRFAAALYPEQLRERDEQSGRLPLHNTSALSCERSANSIDKAVLRLWPRGAWCHDDDGRLAINLAIEAGKPWRFIRALLLCAPPSLLTRDTKTQMMPFMIAATSPDASLDCSYRLLRDSVDVITSALASKHKCGPDSGSGNKG